MQDCDTVFRRGNVGVGRCRVVTIAWPCLPCPVLSCRVPYLAMLAVLSWFLGLGLGLGLGVLGPIV